MQFNLSRFSRLSMVLMAGASFAHAGNVIFSNFTPDSLPADFASSIGYESYAVSQFGGAVTPDLSSGNVLTSAKIGLSNWATQAQYPGIGDANGYQVTMSLILYALNGDGTVGDQFASSGPSAINVQWRPADSASCSDTPGTYMDGNGVCQYGQATTANFSFDNVLLTGSFVWGLKFDTQDYGDNPLGTAVPSNSLNIGFGDGASVGSTPYLDVAYFSSSDLGPSGCPDPDPNYPGIRGCGGGTPNVFSPNSGWSGQPAAQFEATSSEATPEPATGALLGLGVALCAFGRKRFKSAR